MQYGKDFYHRAHPEDLKKFYAAVDDFHASLDTLTEFDSLSGLAAQMLPGAWAGRPPAALSCAPGCVGPC